MALITYKKETNRFILSNAQVTLVIDIINGYPVERYLGPALRNFHGTTKLEDFNHAFAVQADAAPYSLTTLPFVYSTTGTGDYRTPGYVGTNSEGHKISLMKYVRHQIIQGSPDLGVLPTLRNPQMQTLCLVLEDPYNDVNITLQLGILEDLPVITSNVRFDNYGKSSLLLSKAQSLQLSFPGDEYDLFTLTGTHAQEANITRSRLRPGISAVGNNAGASGPQSVPFFALGKPDVTEHNGLVIGSTLFWSGDFTAEAEVDQYHNTRALLGFGDQDWRWSLSPNDSLQTPLTTTVVTTRGLNGMSQTFHQLFNQYVVRPGNPRLITYNTWESFYFDISENKILNQLQKIHDMSIELVVLDDGWFINRNGEDGQLGDWIVDPQKFPNGLAALALHCHQKKMRFGVWIEPEMVTTNSKIYEQHPNWVLQFSGQAPLTSRNQLVLDLSQKAVQDHIISTVSNLITKNNIDYLKWDYNRHFTQPGSVMVDSVQQASVSTMYMLGLYHILQTLRSRFPDVIIENCSAGGGRLDAGLIAYTDQTWVSDLTDSVLRMKIINGFSLVFPPNIFVSHVTDSPNAQDHRHIPLKTRLILSSTGVTGLECNPEQLPKTEQKEITTSFFNYKRRRQRFPEWNYLRLESLPSSKEATALLMTTPDRRHARLILSLGLTTPVHSFQYLPLRYLNPSLQYHLANNTEAGGDELNFAGITLPTGFADFTAEIQTFDSSDI